jgi:hypothetical protein
MRLLGRLSCSTLLILAVSCQMPNPEFDEHGEGSETRGTLVGDGDGDPSTGDGDGDGEPTGDGDGDPTAGDGDGDPTGDGDGDGDPTGDGDGDPTGDGDGDPVECVPGQMFCDGECVNTDVDPLHCGGCNSECIDQLCGFGECKPRKYVFATDTKHNGNFLGLDAANQICTGLAELAQLPIGNYQAWLSDGEKSPSTTFMVDGVFVLRQGGVVAYSLPDLFDGELAAPINRTENGEPLLPTPACDNSVEYAIWTGTAASGVTAEPTCSGWTNAGLNGGTFGRVGNADSMDSTWSSTDCVPPCNALLPIYCVQQ